MYLYNKVNINKKILIVYIIRIKDASRINLTLNLFIRFLNSSKYNSNYTKHKSYW